MRSAWLYVLVPSLGVSSPRPLFPARRLRKSRPVPRSLRGSPRKVYSSPTVSKPVTVSMSEPQSLTTLPLCVSPRSLEPWTGVIGRSPTTTTTPSTPGEHFQRAMRKTNKQTFAVIHVTLFGPPATCKLLTMDWMFSICSPRRPWLILA